MSRQLISRNTDLKRLRDEGYEVEVRENLLLIHAVPYVNSNREVALGTLVSALSLNGDITVRPNTHVVQFSGDHPCTKDGLVLQQIAHASGVQQLLPGLFVQHSFSNKPAAGYADFYEKMTRYIDIISGEARALRPDVTARTFLPIASSDKESVFHYIDTASSRAGITMISKKLEGLRLAIIGLGGTGSYVLDLVAKTSVREIHLFDRDLFQQHNAFRSPGAASLGDLQKQSTKVAHFAQTYSNMRSGVIPHTIFVEEANVLSLCEYDFVFVCVDKGSVRKLVLEALRAHGRPFVDVGMGVEVTPNETLLAVCRVTAGTAGHYKHLERRVPLSNGEEDAAYTQNIQIAELNALNAALAVIKWKKTVGFYEDVDQEHHSTYSSNFQLLTSEERA